jgi:hypothetical protein
MACHHENAQGVAIIAMNWDIGQNSAHTFHNKSKMVKKDL